MIEELGNLAFIFGTEWHIMIKFKQWFKKFNGKDVINPEIAYVNKFLTVEK